MTTVKFSDCFHLFISLLCYVLRVVKLVGMICKLDMLQENFQIGQCNLQLATLADWTEHMHVKIGVAHQLSHVDSVILLIYYLAQLAHCAACKNHPKTCAT